MRLIDADALKDRLDYCVKEGMGSTIAFTFKHMVDDAPTIEPKRGKWIFQFRDSENEAYICSKCGSMQGFKHNFCPNCGADMRGKDDE